MAAIAHCERAVIAKLRARGWHGMQPLGARRGHPNDADQRCAVGSWDRRISEFDRVG